MQHINTTFGSAKVAERLRIESAKDVESLCQDVYDTGVALGYVNTCATSQCTTSAAFVPFCSEGLLTDIDNDGEILTNWDYTKFVRSMQNETSVIH